MKVLWRVTKEAKKYRAYLFAAALSTLILTGLNLFTPRIQQLIVTHIVEGLTDETVRQVIYLTLILLAIYLIRALFRFLSNVLAHKAAWNIVQLVRMKLYSKMQTFSTEYFTSAQTGDLMSRVVNDTATFEMLYAHIIPDGIINAITLVGVTIILFAMNAKLALLTCIPIPFIILFGIIFAKKIRPIVRGVPESLSEINNQLHDNFAGILEIRAFGQADREEKGI